MTTIPATLTVVEGENIGQRYVIEPTPFTIGRDAECNLTLSAPGISRLHTRIERSYGQYRLIDMGSTNGTFVNDQRVYGERTLHHGDLIRFASAVTMLFEDPAATAQIDIRELSIGGIQVDEARKEVFVNGQLLHPPLSPRQYVLLELLVRREGTVVEREEIAAVVWPDQVDISDEMIDTLVSRLRRRLADYDADRYIVTRRGFGLMYSRSG